jgi:steroid 5-alpha reductase family enzyme
MTPWSPPLWLGAAVALAMAGGWWWQRRRANAGIVDAIWAAGLAAAAVFYALVGDGATLPRLLLALLGGAWGLRLAWHLWTRVRSEDEDGRYRRLRAAWNGHQGRFFAFFQFQALLVVLFSLPLLAVARNPVAQATAWTVLGVAVWLGSVAGEALADRQLARFRADPGNRGRVCDRGLWRYSRHPNYFFEWLHWFAYAFLAVGSPVAWLAWTGPLLMFVFLRWLSGVPWTEQQALRTRGAAYRDYQRRTPMFFPWFPRDHAADHAADHAQEDAP